MPVTAEGFLAVLEKSRLLSPGQLAKAHAIPGQDPQVIAQALIQQGQLTRWQAQQLLAGRHSLVLGKYKLLDKLGEGGMGAVYKAAQSATGRLVAIKVMSENVVKQPGAVSRFHREIRAVSSLEHPNIVAGLDADQVGDTHFLVMEYAAGRDLKEWIKEYGKLPVDWSCECIRQAALGLQHAHERGLAHRDIKPSNILVVSDDVGECTPHAPREEQDLTRSVRSTLPIIKILDMGLARFTSETQCTVLTQTGQCLGTIDYISPEQARDTKSAGIQADIFSLGASLFHMITGVVPFIGRNPMEKLMARAMRDAPRASTLSPAIPPDLDAIIARMLARKPEDRFQTPDEAAAALAPFCLGAATDQSSLMLPKSAVVTTDSTIEAEADQTLNRFLGSLESEPAAPTNPTRKRGTAEATPVREAKPSFDSNHQSEVPSENGDEARLRPTERSPESAPRQLPVTWIAGAGIAVLLGIVALFLTRGGGDPTPVKSTPPKQIAAQTLPNPRVNPPIVPTPTPITPPTPIPVPIPTPTTAAEIIVPVDTAQAIALREKEEAIATARQAAFAKQLNREIVETNSIGMKLALIPTGTFLMGSPDDEPGRNENEGPQHEVTITRSFAIGVHEITIGQYRTFISKSGHKHDGAWEKSGETDDHPVAQVTWFDAEAFCKWLSEKEGKRYKLPTEAQWEYSCRAGSGTKFYFGIDDEQLLEYCWYNRNSGGKPQLVGQKKPNAWALYDMHGNLWEWTADFYQADYDKESPKQDPPGPSVGAKRTCRGGAWHGNWGAGARACRSAIRYGPPPSSRNTSDGFRVVCEIEDPPPVVTVPEVPAVPSAPPLAVAPFDAAQAKAQQKAWAKHLIREPVETNSIGMKLALIPPGEFLMGSTPEQIERARKEPHAWAPPGWDKSEAPPHTVRITKAFQIGAYEVKQGEFEKLMPSNPSDFKLGGDHPVEQVSWAVALEFCHKLSSLPAEKKAGRVYRLPTEAEWEYACRAGTATVFPWGDSLSSNQANLDGGSPFGSAPPGPKIGKTTKAGAYPANSWGLHDMQGNVWEWCQDGPRVYSVDPATDPIGPETADGAHILRGGCWNDAAWFSRSALRNPRLPSRVYSKVGFRVAAEISEPPPEVVSLPYPVKTGPAVSTRPPGETAGKKAEANPDVASAAWRPLFNGKDLTGWRTAAPADFRFEEIGGQTILHVAKPGELNSVETFGDFHLALEFQSSVVAHVAYHIRPASDGGFNVSLSPDIWGKQYPWSPKQSASPGQIQDGRIAEKAGTLGAVWIPKPASEWNRLDIVCLGDTALHAVNGKVLCIAADLRHDGVPMTKGRLQLNFHQAGSFRSVRIRPITALPAEFGGPKAAAP